MGRTTRRLTMTIAGDLDDLQLALGESITSLIGRSHAGEALRLPPLDAYWRLVRATIDGPANFAEIQFETITN